MKYRIIAAGVMLFALGTAAFSQKVPDKPLNEWGKEESIRIVNESPWAKSYQSTAAASGAAASQIAREQQQSRVTGAPESYRTERNFGPPPIRMRLHSGLPLRQAMVRLQQLGVGYDKLSDAERAQFDASKKGYLDCAICKNFYVITIYRDRDASRSTVEEGIFQGMTMEDLKGQVKLENDKGEAREIFQFNAPKGPDDPAVLYFKRTDDAGNNLITKETKDFKISFAPTFLDPAKNRFAVMIPRTMEFKVAKLISGDNILF